MRYDFPAGTGRDVTVSRQLRVPQGAQEVWVEIAVRFSRGFTLQGNGQGAGQSYKLLHVNVTDNAGGRFGFEMDGGNNGNINAVAPHDSREADWIKGIGSNSTLLNGEWHVLRYHVRLGSSDFHEAWFNGAFEGSKTLSTRATAVIGVRLGANLNMLAAQAQSVWWGRVAVWTTDPGW